MQPTDKCVIISAPSGAGKTTIVHHLLAQDPRLAFSVSATNRPRRAHEVDGHDYFFLSTEAFQERIAADAFVEWEEVYPGQYYGTLRSELERIWQQGRSPIFDVDVIGGLHLKEVLGEHALAMFIHPPSLEILEQRLVRRATESDESLRRRVEKAALELTYAERFDVVVVNDVLERAFAEATALVNNFLRR